MENKIKVARDKDGTLCLYLCEPFLKDDMYACDPPFINETHSYIELPRDMFPEVTFEGGPVELSPVLKKKKEAKAKYFYVSYFFHDKYGRMGHGFDSVKFPDGVFDFVDFFEGVAKRSPEINKYRIQILNVFETTEKIFLKHGKFVENN